MAYQNNHSTSIKPQYLPLHSVSFSDFIDFFILITNHSNTAKNTVTANILNIQCKFIIFEELPSDCGWIPFHIYHKSFKIWMHKEFVNITPIKYPFYLFYFRTIMWYFCIHGTAKLALYMIWIRNCLSQPFSISMLRKHCVQIKCSNQIITGNNKHFFSIYYHNTIIIISKIF